MNRSLKERIEAVGPICKIRNASSLLYISWTNISRISIKVEKFMLHSKLQLVSLIEKELGQKSGSHY